jgi:ATP-dependent DNA helicase RecG
MGEVAKRLKAAIRQRRPGLLDLPAGGESEAIDLAAAEARAADLRRILGAEVGLAHGQMPGPRRTP